MAQAIADGLGQRTVAADAVQLLTEPDLHGGDERSYEHMISLVPQPSAVATITRERAACFWRLLRSTTLVSRRTRSCGVTETTMPALIEKA